MDAFLLFLRVGLALTVVVVLLWLAQKKLSQGARQRGQSAIEVVGRRSVGQKSSVVVIEAEGRRFLLGVTEQSINVLHSGPAPLPGPAALYGTEPLFGVEPGAGYPEPSGGEAAFADAGFEHGDQDTAFDEVLRAAGEPGLRRDQRGARRLRRPEHAGALHGTIFARSTWTQAGAAVRKGRNP